MRLKEGFRKTEFDHKSKTNVLQHKTLSRFQNGRLRTLNSTRLFHSPLYGNWFGLANAFGLIYGDPGGGGGHPQLLVGVPGTFTQIVIQFISVKTSKRIHILLSYVGCFRAGGNFFII